MRPIAVLAIVVGSVAGGLGAAHVAHADSTIWVATAIRSLGPSQAYYITYICPPDYPFVGDLANPELIPFKNQSDPSVSATLSNGGYGSHTIEVQFINWSPVLDSQYYVTYACHGASPAPSPAPTAPPAPVNDTDPTVVYSGSGWGYSAGRPASFNDFRGDVHYTLNNGDSVVYTFSGTSVTVYSELSSDEGQVDAYVDGQFRGTYSAYGNLQNYGGQPVYRLSGLQPGNHNLLLVKKTGTYMLVDAFQAS